MSRIALIVEDVEASRHALAQIAIELFPGIEVAAFANLATARAFLRGLTGAEALDFALVDLGLPDGSGIELIRELGRNFPATVPVVTTIYGDDRHLFEAIAAGAQGYLLKDDSPESLRRELVGVTRGEPALSPAVARRMLTHFRAIGTPQREAALTNREMQVLTLLGLGLRIKEIAREIALSEHTVRDHVKAIYRKLNVASRAEAAIEAVRRGLV